VEQQILLRAAELHHRPSLLLDSAATGRLLASLRVEATGAPLDSDALAREVLRVRVGEVAEAPPEVMRLASVLELCDDFDESFEWEPLDPQPADAVDSGAETVLDALRLGAPLDLDLLLKSLPVFPAIAHQALRLLSDDNAGFREIERLVSSDPVLAGEIVRSANSADIGARERISSIRGAISYIGADRARHVIFSASLRPIFSAGRARQVWNHSLETATGAEAIARLTQGAEPEQAFLAGLVHDVGRLAILRVTSKSAEACVRLIEAGCPPTQAEIAIFGHSHADIGRIALERWGFPAAIPEAVGHHHSPERSKSGLSAILYLAEDLCATDEDLPSVARLRSAHARLGLNGKPLDIPVVRTTMQNLASARFTN
jgi:putative nucleotidyltransferase with HDIG domain